MTLRYPALILALAVAAPASAQDLTITASGRESSSTGSGPIVFEGRTLGERSGSIVVRYTVSYNRPNDGFPDQIEDIIVGFYRSDDPFLSEDDLLLDQEEVDVQYDEPEDDSESISISGYTRLGDYFLLVVLDVGDRVAESDETNNTVAIPFTVRDDDDDDDQPGTGGGDGGDLQAGASAPTRRVTRPGEVFRVTFGITLRGTNDDANVAVGIYLSKDRTFSDDDLFVERDLITTRDARFGDEYRRANISERLLEVPDGTPRGPYYLLFVADEFDVVAEPDETNNTFFQPFYVGDFNDTRAISAERQELDEGEGYYFIAPALEGDLALDDGDAHPVFSLFDPLWTQGFPGSNAPDGAPNVFVYDETEPGLAEDGYKPPASANDHAELGKGYIVYAFSDDDPSDPEVDGFPKILDLFGRGLVLNAYETFTFDITFTDAPELSGDPEGSPDLDNDDDGQDDDGWNLIGNPSSNRIGWADGPSLFFDTNWVKEGIENTIWTYSPAQGYVSYNATTMAGTFTDGIVLPWQAFWVHAIAPDPRLVYRSGSTRVYGGDFYGREAAPPPAVSFRIEGAVGDVERVGLASVAWAEPCAVERDYECDAVQLRSLSTTSLDLFALALDEQGRAVALDISGLPLNFGASVDVDLGVRARAGGQPAGGEFMLSWPDLRSIPAGWTLRLRDNELDRTVPLDPGGQYAFTLTADEKARTERPVGIGPTAVTADEGGARFTLLVAAGVSTSAEPDPIDPFALSTPAPNPVRGAARLGLTVSEAQSVRVEVYDALGRRVALLHEGPAGAGQTLMLTLDTRTLSPGAYVVRAVGERGEARRSLTVIR